jgi:hypothetical protein
MKNKTQKNSIKFVLVLALTALIASAFTISIITMTTSTTIPSVKTIYKDIIKKVKVPVFINKPNTDILKEDQIIKLSEKYMRDAGHNLDEYELRPITMKLGSESITYRAYFDQSTNQWSVIYRLIEYSDANPTNSFDTTLPAKPFYPKECFVKIDKLGNLVEKIQCLRPE